MDSDSTDYVDTEDEEDEIATDDDLVSLSPEEKLDTKYLATFPK